MSTTPSARATGRASIAATPAQRGAARRPGAGPGRPGPVYRGRGPRPRWGRIFLVLGVGALVLALLTGGAGYWWYTSVDDDIKRTDPFAGVSGNRPARLAEGALNILMLGSDSRDPDNKARAGEWRTDTMILAHIPASHDRMYNISLPRDLYVPVPKSPTNPKLGGTRAKLNAAFAWGGLPLTVQTIEQYTGVHIDHVVLIDFGGFKQVVDALGGVEMNIEQTITSIHPPKRVFQQGVQQLDGAAALDYVRQRYQFADGDFTRMRHQQQFMKAVLDKAASAGTLSNPLKLNSFLRATAKAVTVDQELSPMDLALDLRNIRSSNLVFTVSPHVGSKRVNGEDVIMPDPTKGAAMYEALRKDRAAEWFAQNPPPARSTK